MAPKTQFQRQVVELSARLPKIKEKTKRRAEKELFPAFYIIQRNRNYCLNCGHKWEPLLSEWAQDVVGVDCPSCKATKMKKVVDYKPHKAYSNYWSIIDVVDDVQVVRMIECKVWLHKERKPDFSHREVMQHYINENGQYESRQALNHSMGYYFDQWVSGEIELRSKSDGFYHRMYVTPSWIRPGRKTLPIIRRNGYKGYFYGEQPAVLFINILSNQKAETLLKAKQKSLFNDSCNLQSINERVHKYWPSICIAMRNDYIVEDASDWYDMLRMLEYLGKDIRNPEYICPSDFHNAHQAVLKTYHKVKDREAKEEAQRKALANENQYREAKQKYLDLTFSEGCVQIAVAKSVKEVITLGKKLHHCLGASYAMKENSLILGAYVNGEPVEAIEYNLARGQVFQSRGLQNKSSKYHDAILQAVEAHKHLIRQRSAAA